MAKKGCKEEGDCLAAYREFVKFRESRSNEFSSETEAALAFMKHNLNGVTERKFPPIYFLHQLYVLIKNKTKVDREANALQLNGKIIFYKLGGDKDNVAELVVFFEDIKEHILKCSQSAVVSKFVDQVLPKVKNVFVDAVVLRNTFSLTDSNIRELVQENILVIRDVGSYWLSFPKAGEYVKSYNWGRREILRIIKKSNYSEILETELRKRKLGKKATLGMAYHIMDVMGSEAVKCIYTTSGALLRNDSST